MIEVKLPELGEGIEKAVVTCWHVQAGDQVNAGDDIVELVTDKAIFNVASDSAGKLTKIFCSKGEEANIGQVLAHLE